MTARRLEMYRLVELVRLHRMGKGVREVARLLAMGPNTERRYRQALEQAGLLRGSPAELPTLEELKAGVLAHCPPKAARQQQSSVADWLKDIDGLVRKGLKPKAIYDRLRLERPDFDGQIGAIKRMYKRLRRAHGVQSGDVAIVVETEPGAVAQVDFGYAGRLLDGEGRLRKAWVFVMVLEHSRHMFAKVVFDQRSETWLQLHVDAFRALGGVPKTVVPDNLKAAVIRTAFGADAEVGLNRSYRELAQHYGFIVEPTPPRSPEKKGKVEAGVKYVKRNALAGREGERADEVNKMLVRWVTEIAGARQHGTTGRKPLEVFNAEEKPALMALPKAAFEMVTWKRG